MVDVLARQILVHVASIEICRVISETKHTTSQPEEDSEDIAACAPLLIYAWTFSIVAKHDDLHISNVSYVKPLSKKNITTHCYLPISHSLDRAS